MTAINIIPAQNNVDIELYETDVVISQTDDDRNVASVVFHRRYIPEMITALEGLRQQSDDDLLNSVKYSAQTKSVNFAVQNPA